MSSHSLAFLAKLQALGPHLSSSSASLEKHTELAHEQRSSPILRKQIEVHFTLFSSLCVLLTNTDQSDSASLYKIEVHSQCCPYGFLLSEYLVETFPCGQS